MNSEYLPDASTEKRKAFTIAPAEQDWGQVIVQARREALEDPDLTDGAKALFAYLLDLSLQKGTQRWFGVVAISATKLSERLHRSKRAIYGWNKELLAKRFIWITELLMPNAWPLNTYHISALDSENEPSQMPTRDGMWGNGARRQKIQPGLGARGGRVHKTARQNLGSENANSSVSEENAPASGTKGHAPHADNATGSRRTCDGESQSLRLGAAESAIGSGTKEHLAVAEKSTGQRHKPALFNKTLDTRKESLETKVRGKGVSAPPEKASKGPKGHSWKDPWEAWEATLADMFSSKLEKLLGTLTRERTALRANQASYALDLAKLKPDTREWLAFCDREIERLEKGGEKKRADAQLLLADRKTQRAAVLGDPASYTERSLTQEAAARLEALNRKISMVKERLEGPKV